MTPEERIELWLENKPEEKDTAFIREFFGRERYTPLAIVDRCPSGHPRVVLSFRGKSISMTSLWLCCPEVHRRVSRLESSGGVDRIERALGESEERLRDFQRSQGEYGELLDALFERFLPQAELKRHSGKIGGVAGVADARFVKCLHAHVAFTLATGEGPAGRLALQSMGFEEGEAGVWIPPCCTALRETPVKAVQD